MVRVFARAALDAVPDAVDIGPEFRQIRRRHARRVLRIQCPLTTHAVNADTGVLCHEMFRWIVVIDCSEFVIFDKSVIC